MTILHMQNQRKSSVYLYARDRSNAVYNSILVHAKKTELGTLNSNPSLPSFWLKYKIQICTFYILGA